MISTERLDQIQSAMDTHLPLETHGSNAFDSVTRILVADVHGMLALIREQAERLEQFAKSMVEGKSDLPAQASDQPDDPDHTPSQNSGMDQGDTAGATEQGADTQAGDGSGIFPPSHEPDTQEVSSDDNGQGSDAEAGTGDQQPQTDDAGAKAPPESDTAGAGTEADESVPAAAPSGDQEGNQSNALGSAADFSGDKPSVANPEAERRF